MVEQAWLDKGDVVVTKQVLKNYDNMRNCLEWLNFHHPEVLKEYNESKLRKGK